ncbi:SDR family NAD(P)-dependent oxidoreductase [Streptomyces sp. NPDC002920]
MSKVIAVFGAGTGLGASVARRFGREGFRVALVARRKDRLDTLVAQLAEEGVEAAAFPADLSDAAAVPGLVDAIRDRFGRIDVVEYAPIAADMTFTPATELDAATLESLARLYLFTPVEVFHAVLPEMIERGDGAVLMGTGYSAVQPMPNASGVGPAMAGARNYLYSLNAELADKGVYAGTLSVAALIANSAAAVAVEAQTGAPVGTEPITMPNGFELPVVDPDDLAEHYWDMYTKRDRVERIHPEPVAPRPGTTA